MKNKSTLQKSAYYIGIICFLASIASLVYLYFKVDIWGWQHPASASMMATSFFFITGGIVLIVIGRCNIPSFKLNNIE